MWAPSSLGGPLDGRPLVPARCRHSVRTACCPRTRRADAQSLRELFPRSPGAQRARAGTAAPPHPQSRPRRAQGRPGGRAGQPHSRCRTANRSAAALDRPRWLLGPHLGLDPSPICGFDGHLVDRLLSAGHDVDVIDARYSDTMGHAGAVILHPDGRADDAHHLARPAGADPAPRRPPGSSGPQDDGHRSAAILRSVSHS
jgi:hypothetical protein